MHIQEYSTYQKIPVYIQRDLCISTQHVKQTWYSLKRIAGRRPETTRDAKQVARDEDYSWRDRGGGKQGNPMNGKEIDALQFHRTRTPNAHLHTYAHPHSLARSLSLSLAYTHIHTHTTTHSHIQTTHSLTPTLSHTVPLALTNAHTQTHLQELHLRPPPTTLNQTLRTYTNKHTLSQT